MTRPQLRLAMIRPFDTRVEIHIPCAIDRLIPAGR
jgi:hypothetical protein